MQESIKISLLPVAPKAGCSSAGVMHSICPVGTELEKGNSTPKQATPTNLWDDLPTLSFLFIYFYLLFILFILLFIFIFKQ